MHAHIGIRTELLFQMKLKIVKLFQVSLLTETTLFMQLDKSLEM